MDNASSSDPSVVGSRRAPGPIPWDAIYESPAFKALVEKKIRFVVPVVVFFIVWYFALPILVGYAPGLMEQKVVGNINLAYVFALSEFVVGWLLMVLYARRARVFDAESEAVIAASGVTAEEKR